MTEREDVEFAKRIAEPLREAERVEPAFEARLLAAVRAATDRGEVAWAHRSLLHRRLGWLTKPRRLMLSPLGALALAAGFAAVVAASTLAIANERAARPFSEHQLVQFAIAAPQAKAVALVGDFNAWNASTIPMTKGAVDGLWMATVPLAAGSYQYAFVLDGATWTADPASALTLEDEFGTPSSLIRIQGGRT